MEERREGWYWVRFCADWECAKWTGEGWRRGNVTSLARDSAFEEIGIRIPTPDEPFKCVPVEPATEMVDAASEAYMPFGDMALAIQAAIAYAPEDDQRTAPKLATRA